MKKNSDLDTLSDRLNFAINKMGIKKAELARQIGIQPQTLQYLCDSKANASKFTFEIATVLGVDTKWLATGNGDISGETNKENLFFN